jgi:hypothetical protein
MSISSSSNLERPVPIVSLADTRDHHHVTQCSGINATNLHQARTIGLLRDDAFATSHPDQRRVDDSVQCTIPSSNLAAICEATDHEDHTEAECLNAKRFVHTLRQISRQRRLRQRSILRNLAKSTPDREEQCVRVFSRLINGTTPTGFAVEKDDVDSSRVDDYDTMAYESESASLASIRLFAPKCS